MITKKVYTRYWSSKLLSYTACITVFPSLLLSFTTVNNSLYFAYSYWLYWVIAFLFFLFFSLYFSRTVVKINGDGISLSKLDGWTRKTTKITWSEVRSLQFSSNELSLSSCAKSQSTLTIKAEEVYYFSELVNIIDDYLGHRFVGWYDKLDLMDVRYERKQITKVILINTMVMVLLIVFPILNSQLDYVYVSPFGADNIDFYILLTIIIFPLLLLAFMPFLYWILNDINKMMEKPRKQRFKFRSISTQSDFFRGTKFIQFLVFPTLLLVVGLDFIGLYNEHLLDTNQLKQVTVTADLQTVSSDRQFWHIFEKNGQSANIGVTIDGWTGMNKQLEEKTFYQISVYQGEFGYILMTEEQFANAQKVKPSFEMLRESNYKLRH